MYLVRFDGTSETWATKLTGSSAALPPYSTGPTDGSNVIFIWWYAHHGRIVSDGTNYAGYFGAAISVSPDLRRQRQHARRRASTSTRAIA